MYFNLELLWWSRLTNFARGMGWLLPVDLNESMQTLEPHETCTMTPPDEISKRVDVTPTLALFETAWPR